jgi:TonB family protein
MTWANCLVRGALVLAGGLLPVALVTVHAQTGRGTLAGTVQDASRMQVPGAEVHVKNLDGRNEEVTNVGVYGKFEFANIPVGRYALEARSPGFAVGKAEVLVEAGGRAETVVMLPLGEVKETMTIRGTRPPNAPPAPARAAPVIRIPVGGNVQPAKLVKRVKPVYPEGARFRGISSSVVVRAVISVRGEILNPEVINSNVDPSLAQAVLEAVRQWRYEPTLLNGEPVEVATTIEFNFYLD